MFKLSDFVKRQEYGYTDDSKNLDSIRWQKKTELYPYYCHIKYIYFNENQLNFDELVSKFALDVMLFERKDKASFFERDGSLTVSKSFFDGKLIGGFHTKADFDAFFDRLSANLAEGGDGRIVEYTFTTDRTKIPTGLY